MSELELQTLGLTFQIALLSAVVVVPLSMLVALLLLRLSPAKQVVGLSVLSLPMALPPVITGYLLLLVCGRQSYFGAYLFEVFGIQISFSFVGAILASSIVSFPFALRSVMVSLKSIDQTLIDAAVTLGLSPWRTFWWIVLPLSWPGIVGAGILAFVRAFGEFGATVVFAGGIFGESRTLSVTVWNLMQMPDQEDTMWRLLALSILFCLAALVISELLFKRMNSQCSRR
jgi:molybdate transport system permease protein